MRVDNEVLAVLSLANVCGNAVTLVGQLDRKLYERTNKVLEAAGGAWNRKAKAHLFEGDALDRIEQIILTGDIDVPKDDFEFFPTPPAVVARLLELARIDHCMRILEPSAGRGAIAIPCVEAGGHVDCYEMMAANFALLSKDDRLGEVHHGDFLLAEPRSEYDRVIMNPPFSRQTDIQHVLHALKFLKPGGLLVSVMSASVGFRENKLTADFRGLVAQRGGFLEPLPEHSFKSSGTRVGTLIAVIPG